MTVSRNIIIDLSANRLLNFIFNLQRERNLSNEDMELVITKVLLEVKNAKETDYANSILDLTYQLQQKEQEKEEEKKEE